MRQAKPDLRSKFPDQEGLQVWTESTVLISPINLYLSFNIIYTKWQATKCPSPIFFNSGFLSLHTSLHLGHLLENGHPLGILRGEGISPFKVSIVSLWDMLRENCALISDRVYG